MTTTNLKTEAEEMLHAWFLNNPTLATEIEKAIWVRAQARADACCTYAEDVLQILVDYEAHPAAVNLEYGGTHRERAHTIATMVIEAEAREMLAAVWDACQETLAAEREF